MKHFRLILFIVFALSSISCKLRFFRPIRVKASPEFNIAAGTGIFKTDDFFSPKIILEQVNQTGIFSKSTILDYTKDDTMNMLIRYPITDLELDMADNFTILREAEKIMSDSLEKRSYALQKPEKISKEIDLEFIQDKLYGGLQKHNEIDVPKPISGAYTLPALELPIDVPFSKALFDTNTKLILSTSTDNSQISFEITDLKLITAGGETLSSAGTAAPNILELSGKTINKPEKIIITCKASGPEAASVKLIMESKFQGRIKEAWGLNFNLPNYEIDDIILPLSLPSGDSQFEEAKISDGDIIIKKFLPHEWTGFEIDYSKLTASQEKQNGVGLDLTLTGETVSLNNQTINKNNIKISGHIGLTIQNAHYSYAEKGTAEFDIAIKKFGYVKLKMPEHIKFSYTKEQPIPEDLKKWVKLIHFTDLSIQLNLENNLPADNDVEINVSSKSFDINETKLFKSNLAENAVIKKTNFDFEPKKIGNMDFSVKVKFQNYSGADNIITIKNIEIGKEYSFGGNFTIKPNWEYAVINPGDMGRFTGSFPAEENRYLELGSLSELIKNGLTFEGLKARLYLNSDFLGGKGNKLTGKMYFSYIDENTGLEGKSFLAGTENSEDEFRFVKALPEEFYADTAKTYIEYTGSIPDSSKEMDISQILKPKQKNIKFFYDISLSELRIYETDIKNFMTEEKKAKLSADILLEIPFIIKADKDIVLKTINGKQDILNRSGSETDKISEKTVQFIKELELKIKYKNRIGIGVKAQLINKTNSGNPQFIKDINLQNTEDEKVVSLLLDKNDITYIKNQYPFIMDIQIILPAGRHSFKRGKEIEIKPFLRMALAIDETIGYPNKK